MVFVHPRTGRSWATESMAIEMDGPLVSPAPIGPGEMGTLVQTGEYAGNYSGWIEPMQVAYSDVTGLLKGEAKAISPTNYGTADNPSPLLKTAQDTWAKIVAADPTAQNWETSKYSGNALMDYYNLVAGEGAHQAILQTTPDGAMAESIVATGGYAGVNKNLGVVTAPVSTWNNPTSPLSPGSPVSGAGAGSLDVMQAPSGGGLLSALTGSSGSEDSSSSTGGLLSSIGTVPLILGAIIFALFIGLLMMGRRSSAPSEA